MYVMWPPELMKKKKKKADNGSRGEFILQL